MPSQIAAQLYTLREFAKTPKEIAATLARVRTIGYTAVQVSGIGPIAADELATILDGEGLTCCVTHRSLDDLEQKTAQVIEDHRTLGCQYTAVGGFFGKNLSADDWGTFIARYNAVAAKFAGSGVRLGYHNHSHELVRYGRATALQRLIDELSPEIFLELDTYWIAHAGGDPAAWIEKVKGRIPCVHLKDTEVTADEQKPVMAEVGEGNQNWPAILRACRASGVEWYIVEQDVCRRDPFESLAISLRNVRAMGVA